MYAVLGIELDDYGSYDAQAGEREGEAGTGSEQDENHIGYLGTYTVGGKTYKNWKQYPLDGSAGTGWAGWLHKSGCGLTSASIILSAIDDKYTPYYLYHYEHGREKVGSVQIGTYLKDAGLSYTTARNLDDVRQGLKQGKKVIMCLTANATINGVSWAGGSGHYITLLDIDSNDNVWVSNPGSRPTRKNGLFPLGQFSGKVYFPHTYIIDVK